MSNVFTEAPLKAETISLEMNGFRSVVALRHTVNYVYASISTTLDGRDFSSRRETAFQGFCNMEIAYRLIVHAIAGRRQIESPDIWEYLVEAYGDCECDDE